jgi:hypothetical protein
MRQRSYYSFFVSIPRPTVALVCALPLRQRHWYAQSIVFADQMSGSAAGSGAPRRRPFKARFHLEDTYNIR